MSAPAKILDELIAALKLKRSTFESETLMGNATIASAIKRDGNVSADMIEKILARYPHVNKDWLKTGKGEMFIDADYAEEIPQDDMLNLEIKLSTSKETILIGKHSYSRLSDDDRNSAFPGWRGIPMYNNAITASFIETYRDEIAYKPTYYLHDVRFKECNFGARVTGDSMHSEIRHGDHVICQEITDTRFIVYGDIYYIVSTNGLETCKYIHPDPDNKTNLLLVARNESVPSSPMPKDMLLKLYKVKGILREY